MSPATALIATCASIAVTIALAPPERGAFCVAAALAHGIITGSLRGPVRFCWWFAAFSLPLVAMHAIFNPSFPVTAHIIGGIPVRQQGLTFAVAQTSLVMTLFVPTLYWLTVPREGLIALICRLPVPARIAIPALDAVALLADMERRIRIITDAQRARGLAVRGAPWRRTGALLALVIPLVATLLREAPVRAAIRHELGTCDALFAAGAPGPVHSRAEALVFTGIVAAAIGLAVLQ